MSCAVVAERDVMGDELGAVKADLEYVRETVRMLEGSNDRLRAELAGVLESQDALHKVLLEAARAEKRFPWWPASAVEAAAIVSEELGELVRAANEYHWFGGPKGELVKEAIQTAAMALRFLVRADSYEAGSSGMNREVKGCAEEGVGTCDNRSYHKPPRHSGPSGEKP